MEEYKTTDLHVAAVLTTLGHQVLRLDPDELNPRTKWFVFRDAIIESTGSNPQEDETNYRAEKCLVEPNELLKNLSRLREWARSSNRN